MKLQVIAILAAFAPVIAFLGGVQSGALTEQNLWPYFRAMAAASGTAVLVFLYLATKKGK